MHALIGSGLVLALAAGCNSQVRPSISYGWLTPAPPAYDYEYCQMLPTALLRPVGTSDRALSVDRLSSAEIIEISNFEAYRLIGNDGRDTSGLANGLMQTYLQNQQARKYRAKVESKDSWSLADEDDLVLLSRRYARGEFQNYRPFLVRAVGNAVQPSLSAAMCGDKLHVVGTVMGRARIEDQLPAIVFLPSKPGDVVVVVEGVI